MEAFAAQNAQLFQTLADAKADEWITLHGPCKLKNLAAQSMRLCLQAPI